MKKKEFFFESYDEKFENAQLLISLGKRIAYLRKKKGLNQTELAERMNKRERQIVQRLEKGKTNCSVNFLRLIAIALQVDIQELFNFPVE